MEKVTYRKEKYESINLRNSYYFMFSVRWITYMYFKQKEKIFFLYWLYRRNFGICNPIFKLHIFIWIDNKG